MPFNTACLRYIIRAWCYVGANAILRTLNLGVGPAYNASKEEIASHADVCNKKKKAAKTAGVRKNFKLMP